MEDITKLTLNKLRQMFGKNHKVYRENQKAGFQEDSFLIPSFTAKSMSEVGKKHQLIYSCQIIYFPRESHVNDDIQSVESALLTGFFSLGDKDVFKRDFVVSDDALVFTFNVIDFVAESDGDTNVKMKTIEGS